MIQGIENVQWKGRIEKVNDSPLIIIDGAHNKESVDALVDTIGRYYGLDKVDILFSAIKGKPISSMLTAFNTIANHFMLLALNFLKLYRNKHFMMK